eukprot:XP_011616400.1 PREDICTED: LOW QUALITY PROTEIN: sorting nexin-19 [Takifugu rubripes]
MISTFHPEGAKGHGSPSGAAMAEVLGQRSLLGFGVLLAWLVLFHLLVNIWLLCVFTSLLVVYGGWLTSQAILESNNLVHLERFITLEPVPSTEGDECQLDEEIHNTVRKIIRDFVASWFSTVSSESAFEKEVQAAMISMAMEMKRRARQVDRKELTHRVLNLFGCHLRDFIRAKELWGEQQGPPAEGQGGLWGAYSRFATPHLAVTDAALEVNYTRAVADLLLQVLVPSPHLESRTGRFVVGELITCNVLLPFFARLSDPDWLNGLIIQVCGGADPPEDRPAAGPPAVAPTEAPPLQEATCLSSPQGPPLRTETEVSSPESAGRDVARPEAPRPQNTTEEEPPGSCLRGSRSSLSSEPEPDSPFGDCNRIQTDSLVKLVQEGALCARQTARSSAEDDDPDLDDGYLSPTEASCPRLLVNSGVESLPIAGCGDRSPRVREASSPLVTPSRELHLGVEQGSPGNLGELSEGSPLRSSSPVPSFSFDPLSSPEGPVIIQNLRITGTITAKEHRGTGSHPYTLYTIKYETAMGCENPGGCQPGPDGVDVVLAACEHPSAVAYHTVNRRYSEFLNLQTRLEEKAELRKLLKGVKGPKKMFPDMPFGNMDSEKIEARKGLLETFLKQLCAASEVAASEEMREFLALNTDARIAFVKKPFIVSRIDKIVVNAIVDTLKTAFPRPEAQSPTEDEAEVDGLKLGSEKKSKSRLRFSNKNVPFVNGAEVRPVQFSCEQRNTVFSRMSLGELETWITEQEKLASAADPEREESPEHAEVLDVRLREKHVQERDFPSKQPKFLLIPEAELLSVVERRQASTRRGVCCFPAFSRHSKNVDGFQLTPAPPEPGHAGALLTRLCSESGGAMIFRVFGCFNPFFHAGSETALAEVALNIACLLIRNQWSWLCTENMQKTVRLLFGTLIDRWLDVGVANLTCTRYWVVYLQVIQEALWPGGTLPAEPPAERSRQQKDATRQEALRSLMRLLPDAVSDMVDPHKYQRSWRSALDSLQDPDINRHLVFCILDLLLELLVPEVSDEGFQSRLLQKLSGTRELGRVTGSDRK